MASFRLSEDEKKSLDRDGFLVREAAFSAGEVSQIQADCEDMCRRLTAPGPPTPKIAAGSYMFQLDPEHVVMLKWEPDQPEILMGVEPFAHFDAPLERWGLDARFTDPMVDLLDAPEVELFTEKLNLKRARHGGPIVLHQDYPYWVDNSENAAEIATAILFLDDATRENGCLEVIPGSHKWGPLVGKGVNDFGKFELDPAAYDLERMRSVEVPAGSLVMFGSLIVHRSTPNLSDKDRRALLYSYQPKGRIKSWEGFAELVGRGAEKMTSRSLAT